MSKIFRIPLLKSFASQRIFPDQNVRDAVFVEWLIGIQKSRPDGNNPHAIFQRQLRSPLGGDSAGANSPCKIARYLKSRKTGLQHPLQIAPHVAKQKAYHKSSNHPGGFL